MSATELKGPTNLGQYSYDEILERNLIMFFDWGFLNKGGFSNVQIPTSGAYGADFSRLRPVADARHSDGQIWEAPRNNWVWESGINLNTQPISISGVFVGSTFYPVSGDNFYIDYPEGRVIFNSGISTSSIVRAAYSFKWIKVCSADDVPWLRKTQTNSFRPDNSNFLPGSGENIPFSQSRVQLPTVAVKITDEQYRPAMIGGGQYVDARAIFYVIAEDKPSTTRIAHLIGSQNEKTIFVFDPNRMAQENRSPLDYKGSIASGALTYPQLVRYSGDGGYRLTDGIYFGKLTLLDSQIQGFQPLTGDAGQKVVTINTESILTKI